MVDSIILDKKRILPCAAYLQGEYGIDSLFIGVPVRLGVGGIEEIIQIQLSSEEKAALDQSAGTVKELVEVMNNRPPRLAVPRRCPKTEYYHGVSPSIVGDTTRKRWGMLIPFGGNMREIQVSEITETWPAYPRRPTTIFLRMFSLP